MANKKTEIKEMNKNVKHAYLSVLIFSCFLKKTLLHGSILYISLLTTIISSFLKAKYILLDAQESIQLITSFISPECSGYATLHPGL